MVNIAFIRYGFVEVQKLHLELWLLWEISGLELFSAT